MKKSGLAFLLICISSPLFSQFSKGDKFINLTGIGYYHQDLTRNERDLKFNLNTSGGCFVAKNFAIGHSLGIGHSETTFYIIDYYTGVRQVKQKDASILLGPIVRYYVPFGKSAIFAQGGAVYDFTRTRLKGAPYYWDSKYDSRFINFELGVGYNYFIASNVALEIIPKYVFRKSLTSNLSNSDFATLNIGVQVFLSKPAKSE